VNPIDFLDLITSVLSGLEFPYKLDLLKTSYYNERFSLTSILELLRATLTLALIKIRP
jgi:hypothetical protein